MNRKEVARLRRVRGYLDIYARGAGADIARREIDRWIEEKAEEAARLVRECSEEPE